MATVPGFGTINPFYNSAPGYVQAELSKRAKYYGARVRSGVTAEELEWSYKKVAWAVVSGGGVTMGTANYKLMSDAGGNLTLYDPTRNQPKFPLLQSLDITNEGMLGSLIKGTFTFLVYPDITKSGFSMGKIDNAFFKPGRSVSVKWGWSVDQNGANSGAFTGIVTTFNWSVNNDLSIQGTVSLVSKGTVAVGVSGETTGTPSNPAPKDPNDMAIGDAGMISVIESELKTATGTAPVTLAKAAYQTFAGTNFTFHGLGMPMNPGTDTPAAPTPGQPPPPPPPQPPPAPVESPVQPIYYITLSDIVKYVNTGISKVPELAKLVTVQVDGNVMQDYEKFASTGGGLRSCAPEKVFFPTVGCGTYGTKFVPTGLPGMAGNGGFDIGKIWISTTTVTEVYKGFLSENQTDIEYKNLTNFFNDLIKEVNLASGEVYQLTSCIIDPPMGNKNSPSVLAIEDANLRVGLTAGKVFFDPSIAKPIIKSVNISCKPPATAAAATFVGGAGATGASTDINYGNGNPGSDFTNACAQIKDLCESFGTTGAGESFTSGMKDAMAVVKRNAGSGYNFTNKVLYPVDFSITIDGIDGFFFGNVIDTNLIPSSYAGMEFVVTKIQHSIKDGIWDTTLITKARI